MPTTDDRKTFRDPDYAAEQIERLKIAEENGDLETKREIFTQFCDDMGGLIHTILKERYSSFYPDNKDDMFNEAVWYCLKGLSTYDPYRSKLSSFFKHRIRKAGKVWIAKNLSFININDQDVSYTIAKIEEKLIEKGIDPTPDNVVRESKGKISLAVYQQNKEISTMTEIVHLDAQTDAGTPLIDGIVQSKETPDSVLIKKEREEIVKERLDKLLNSEERELIDAVFYSELSLAQSAKRMGISEQKAKIIKQTAFAKLCIDTPLKGLWGYSDEVAESVRKHNLRKISLSFSDDEDLTPDISKVLD